MMPATPLQWFWWTFYSVGALGGWLVLAILVKETVKAMRKRSNG